MYLKHFGLERSPYKITPDTSLFYEGGNRGAALEAIKYSILQGEGIIKVVGEVGSGKTMLCRMLEVRLPDYVEIVYLANPSLSPEKILHVIAMEMKLPVAQDDDKAKVMQMLQDYLLEIHAKGRQVVVFVEEAQGMPLETLEEIRLLTNLETGQFKMLQIVLFGQPELDENLGKRQIRQLKERISHHLSLDTFDKKDIQSYLNFRLRAAGFKGADLFSQKLAGMIAKYSKGLTRRINILADKALLAAFADNSEEIKPKYIKLAAKDSQYIALELPVWAKVGVVLMVMAMLMSLGWVVRGFEIEQKIESNTQVISDKNDASDGNKSNLSLRFNGKEQVASLNSEAMSLLLQKRLKRTALWLRDNAESRYSIQLLLLDETRMTALDSFLKRMKEQGLIEDTYVYLVTKNNQLVYGVLYGGFRQYSDAIKAISKLSQVLKVNKPFVRDMQSISTEYI
ncbi:MAG: AAA family ATPase [Gammaproteobacteria bacterium]|nr:AAA family ATPase [Gammaproteobacteria bacterium]